MKQFTKTNTQLVELIQELKKQSSIEKVKIWKRIATDLEKPSRNRRVVNIYNLNKYTRPEETVIIPGKVLGVGELNHKINVAAFNFSCQAAQKIINASGRIYSIYDLMKVNPKGRKVRIIG